MTKKRQANKVHRSLTQIDGEQQCYAHVDPAVLLLDRRLKGYAGKQDVVVHTGQCPVAADERVLVENAIWRSCPHTPPSAFACQMTEPKILDWFRQVQISAGQISNLLIKGQHQFHAEKDASSRAEQ